MEIKNLSFRYRDECENILSNLSLKVLPGETLAIVGKSGCGKSTLLRIIMGMLKPTSGQIIKSKNQRIAMIFQDARLLPWRNALSNVEFALQAQNLSNKEIRLRSLAALERSGGLHLQDLYPRQLSGGQKQIVSFARALVNDPQLLLMDEPFSALDDESKQEMHKLMLRLFKNKSHEVVLVTHDMAEAKLLTDRIINLSESSSNRPEIDWSGALQQRK